MRTFHGEPSTEQIVIYETVPGGAGYLEKMGERLPEMARAAQGALFDHECSGASYLCPKHNHNQCWQALSYGNLVRDVLLELAGLDPVASQPASYGASRQRLAEMLEARTQGSGESFRRYPKGEIEEILLAALERVGISDFQRDSEVRDEEGRLLTVPDLAWPALKERSPATDSRIMGIRRPWNSMPRSETFCRSGAGLF